MEDNYNASEVYIFQGIEAPDYVSNSFHDFDQLETSDEKTGKAPRKSGLYDDPDELGRPAVLEDVKEDKSRMKKKTIWICTGLTMLNVIILIGVIVFSTVLNKKQESHTIISTKIHNQSDGCTAFASLFEMPCIFPFQLNGVEYERCVVRDGGINFPVCPVSMSKNIWGTCNTNCLREDRKRTTSVEPLPVPPILIELWTDEGEMICVGVPITTLHVLIASHCLTNLPQHMQGTRIVTNSHILSIKSEHEIKKVKTHEKFNPEELKHDLTILVLETPLKTTKFLKIGKFDWDDHSSNWDRDLYFTGRTSEEVSSTAKPFQHFSMQLQQSDTCNSIFDAIGYGRRMDASKICAQYKGSPKNYGGYCRGRESGILYFQTQSVFNVIGLLSSPEQNCHPIIPSSFVNIKSKIDWIRRTLEETVEKTDCTTKLYVKEDGRYACGIWHEEWQTPDEGRKLCRKYKASLPDIRSAEENEIYFQHNRGKHFWTDLTRVDFSSNSNSAFKSGGSDLTYTNWRAGEPNDYKEHCVFVDTNGKWVDYFCTGTSGIICEKIF